MKRRSAKSRKQMLYLEHANALSQVIMGCRKKQLDPAYIAALYEAKATALVLYGDRSRAKEALQQAEKWRAKLR